MVSHNMDLWMGQIRENSILSFHIKASAIGYVNGSSGFGIMGCRWGLGLGELVVDNMSMHLE